MSSSVKFKIIIPNREEYIRVSISYTTGRPSNGYNCYLHLATSKETSTPGIVCESYVPTDGVSYRLVDCARRGKKNLEYAIDLFEKEKTTFVRNLLSKNNIPNGEIDSIVNNLKSE